MKIRTFFFVYISIFLLQNICNLHSLIIKKNNIYKDINYEGDGFDLLLQDILVNNLKSYKCIVIITDYIYYDTLHNEWFKKFGLYITYFLILVEDGEDLYTPSNSTLSSLEMARKEGCQGYVILLANALQVVRLLIFGDRYRVLNTRKKFVLLYDNRLFEKNLNYLWKRIINVIFIRKYEGIKKSGQEKNMPWFEITTVPFPSPIGAIFVPKRLDIWRSSHFRKGADLFHDKTYDLRNQTLRVVVFPHIPAVTKTQKSDSTQTARNVVGSGSVGFTGLEVEILVAISKAMRFNCLYYDLEYSPSELWGKKLVGSQYSGLLGEMVKGKADIALGDLYYTPFISELMDLTTPHSTECLTFLTPESFRDNSWKTLVLPFSGSMWCGVLICLFLSGLIFNALARFHGYINKIKEESAAANNGLGGDVKKKKVVTLSLQPDFQKFDPKAKYSLMKERYQAVKYEGQPEGLYLFQENFNSFLYTYSMLLLVSLPKFPTGWSLRVLTGWYWLYSMLVVVSYRASMTAILAKPAPRITIDTLQELVDSKLQCGGRGEINREFFKTFFLDTTSHEIGGKFELVNDTDNAVDRVADGSFAFYENVHFLKEASVKRQFRLQSMQANFDKLDESSGSGSGIRDNAKGDNLHIMSDCMIKMPISIGLQKNSPIQPRIDKYIRRVLEAGLLTKWLDDVMQNILNMAIPKTTETTKAYMSLRKFFGAIVALVIGYFISIVTFIVEILYHHCYIKKHPDYDKYSKSIRHLKHN